MNFLDQAFGIHPAALTFRSQRSALLAANIANADTAGFQARDYDFRTALLEQGGASNPAGGGGVMLAKSDVGHLSGPSDSNFGQLMYRVPTKVSSNGNTVESEVEQTAFAENALRYQTSLQFLNGKIAGLRLAIRGQR